MTTKNIQDVVAEKVEEFRSVSQRKIGEGDIGDMPYTDYEYYFTQEQIDWLTTTLTQLVKEVGAGEEKNIISILENAGYVNVKETLYYHKKPMFVVDKNITTLTFPA